MMRLCYAFFMFPKQHPIVPKIATLFVHHLAKVKEEIMVKYIGGSLDNGTVEVVLLEHVVYVRAVAMHLMGKPFDGSALLVENCFDDMSYMNLRHPCVYKNRGLLSEVEVLEYLLSQQESPRYIRAGDPLSW